MALEMADEDQDQSCAPTRSSIRKGPWEQEKGHAKWQSSFTMPLAHTALRAYLSPKREKKLKAKVPIEELQRQYYNQAIKFSYVKGLFDSHEMDQHAKQVRRCYPQTDSVKEVLRTTDLLPDESRSLRKMFCGQGGCTHSSVDYGVLIHGDHCELPGYTPQKNVLGHDDQCNLPLQSSVLKGPESRWKVSGKIGSRPGRKDKMSQASALTTQPWTAIDISEAIHTEGRIGNALAGSPEVLRLPGNAESLKCGTSSDKPALPKQGRPLRSGIVQLSALSSVPLARSSEPPATKTFLPLPIDEMADSGAHHSDRRKPAGLHVNMQQLLLEAQRTAVPQRSARKIREAACIPLCRRGEASYMPLAAMKPKLMDQVEKTLFGDAVKLRPFDNRATRSPDFTKDARVTAWA